MARVVLTQPLPRIARLACRLRAAGHEVVELPGKRVVALPEADGWGARRLDDADWVVFVSPGGIEVALGALDGRWPAEVGIAVIGPGSLDELARWVPADAGARIVRPARAPYDAQSLMHEAPFSSPCGLRVLVVRGERGRTDWIDALRTRGATVEVATLYRSEPSLPSSTQIARLQEWVAEDRSAMFVFTSLDAVTTTESVLGAAGALGWARACSAITQHSRIREALHRSGWRSVRLVEPGERGLLAGIESGT